MNPLMRLRFDARLSRRELAEQVGVSHETIRRIERGAPFGVGIAGKLADYFNVAPSQLLSDGPDRTPEAA